MQIDTRNLVTGEHRLPCPVCNKAKRDEALHVTVNPDGSAVWFCHRCHESGGSRRGRNFRAYTAPPQRPKVELDTTSRDARERAARIWRASLPVTGTIGADYLQARVCAIPPHDGDLRFHASLWCPETKSELPALVAKVTTVIGNRAIGLHRIWIRPGETKAVKKMRLGGSDEPVCIRLWPNDAVTVGLGIAEGIESALSAAYAMTPVWSTIDAGQLAKFPVIAGLESLTVFADYDNIGYRAAKAVCSRYQHAHVNANLFRSPIVGEDVNDMAMRAESRT